MCAPPPNPAAPKRNLVFMTRGLHRYQQAGDLHFITFSCYQRRPYLRRTSTRDLFESALERMRTRYWFVIIGYVVMPEHVHILMNEPKVGTLAGAIQALKLSVSVRQPESPFWQSRYWMPCRWALRGSGVVVTPGTGFSSPATGACSRSWANWDSQRSKPDEPHMGETYALTSTALSRFATAHLSSSIPSPFTAEIA
jgi:REP element-mobilizing transposase RayT